MLEEYRRNHISPEIKKQVDMQVGVANRIYEILEERCMSQKDLAHLLGKSENEVSRWLSGTHNITFATLAKISCALNEDIIHPTHKPVVLSFTMNNNDNYTFSSNKVFNMKKEEVFVVNY